MFKKFSLILGLTLIASLFLSSAGFAQADSRVDDQGQPRRFLGQITEIGTNQFTIQTRQGESLTLSVDDQTKYRSAKEVGSFDELAVDRWVTGFARSQDGTLTARLVILLPEDFTEADLPDGRMQGKVSQLNSTNQTITLTGIDGKSKTFSTSNDTRYLGGVSTFSDLQTEMNAMIAYQETSDSSLLAKVVAARFQVIRRLGKIVNVDPASNSLDLQSRDGEVLTFHVDDQTVYHSLDKSVQGIDDLTTDMSALVIADQSADDQLVVKDILAGTKDQLSQLGTKLAGRVEQVNENSFTLKTRDGKSYTIDVADDTQFISRNNQVQSLADLKKGMGVGVAGEKLDENTLTAKVLLVNDSLLARLRFWMMQP